jgi:hypothetical protein
MPEVAPVTKTVFPDIDVLVSKAPQPSFDGNIRMSILQEALFFPTPMFSRVSLQVCRKAQPDIHQPIG